MCSAKGRDGKLDDLQSIVEVFAEAARDDLLLEISIGGRKNAQVDLPRRIGAEGLERPVLEDPQQLCLCQQRHLADLIEKQRAAVGRHEASVAPDRRAGEGALLVAEELRFEQTLGERGAVDGDEGFVAPAARGLERTREELLAGATFTGDQHRRVRRCQGVDHLEHGQNRRRSGRQR